MRLCGEDYPTGAPLARDPATRHAPMLGKLTATYLLSCLPLSSYRGSPSANPLRTQRATETLRLFTGGLLP